MKTIEIECRQYDEWEPEVQKVILEKHRDINVYDNDWWDGEYEHWKEKLSEMGYNDVEIAHRISYSQGDGASYTSSIDVEKWIEVNEPVKYARILKLIRSGKIEIDVAIVTRHHSMYVHENTANTYIEWNITSGNNSPNIIEKMNQLEADIEYHRYIQCKAIYRDLEQCYDSLTSDEEVAETLRSNQYEMTSQGEIM